MSQGCLVGKREVPFGLIRTEGGLIAWWEHLRELSPFQRSFPRPTFMLSLGSLPFSSSLKESEYLDVVDTDWLNFCAQEGHEYDRTAFHYTTATHNKNWRATLKYDTEVIEPDFSPELLKLAEEDLFEFFEDLKNQCRVLPFSEVEFNPDSVNGVCMKKAFGCKNKLDAVQKHLDYLELFWKYAHKEHYHTLWTQSGKVEMLKKSKIDNRDIRSFTITPAELFFSVARMCSDMNAKMADEKFWSNSPIKHGIVLSRSGFIDLLKSMQLPGKFFVIEGDCVKWDSRCMPFLFEICKRLRHHCWNKKGMPDQEFKDRMDYYYREIVNSCLYNSTGEVLMKHLGMPSGTNSTTDDNSIIHLFVLCVMTRFYFNKSFYSMWRNELDVALYSDDHVMTASQNLSVPLHEFDVRARIYQRFGMNLDKDKDIVDDTFLGHTFLGLTAKQHPDFGLVPVFNRLKAFNSLEKSDSELDPVSKFCKASAFQQLLAFDDDGFQIARKYALYLKRIYPAELNIHKSWSQKMCQYYWLGKEAGGKEQKYLKFLLSRQSMPKNEQKQIWKNQWKSGKMTKPEYDRLCSTLAKKSSSSSGQKTMKGKGKGNALALNQGWTAPSRNNQVQLGRSTRSVRGPTGATVIMNNSGNKARDDSCAAYLRCLLDPANTMCRMPDGFPRKTFLFRSINSANISIAIDDFNQGRFSFCLQPKGGRLSSPDQFQLAVAKPTNGVLWDDVNWALPASYEGVHSNGRDPRVDINWAIMTAPPPTFWAAQYNVVTAGDLSGSSLVSNTPANTTLNTDNTTFYLASSPVTQNAVFTGIVNPGSLAENGYILLPFGNWNITLIVKYAVSVLPNPNFISINVGQSNTPSQDVAIVSITQPQSVPSGTGVTQTVAASIQVVSSPGHQVFWPILFNTQNGTTIFDPTVAPFPNLTVSVSDIAISPAEFISSTEFLDGGLLEEVRPVAQAVLVTYTGTTLNDGGEIAIGYLPPKLLQTNYFQSNTGGAGQLQRYENLRLEDNIYDNKLKHGAYCIWCPYDELDTAFRSPTENCRYPFPGIVCSGVFQPDQTVNSMAHPIRIMTYTVWEGITKYTCFETKSSLSDAQCAPMARQALKGSTFATANGKHIEWVRNMAAKGLNLYRQNAGWVNPLAAAMFAAL